MTLKEEIGRGIVILDGAMGTMLQRYGLSGNSERFNLTHPDIIAEIHREYIRAGATLIEANTFSANRISQAEYGLSDSAAAMARRGAEIARAVADEANATESAEGRGAGVSKRVYVAGSVGPTSKSLTLAPDIADPSLRPYGFDEMAAAYEEQMRALIEGGVDVIQIETCFDALNAKAALYALAKISDLFPAIVSVSVSDRSGRTLTGQTIEAFYNSVRHYPLTAFGINCSLGAEDMLPLVREIAGFCEFPVICYPNAGLPNELGGYDETPEQMAEHVGRMLEAGAVNIIGGCCGTGPEHIRAIAEKVEAGRVPEVNVPTAGNGYGMVSGGEAGKACPRSRFLKVSGLEAVDVDLQTRNFCNVGERTNVAGSRKFARLIASGEYESALQVAAEQIENGALIIDINMDDAMLDSSVEMEKFVRWIQNDPAVAKAALMIDSSRWETVLAGLKNAQGRCIVNSISLKDGEEQFAAKAREIHRLGAAVVVMAFDEQGQATTYDRKVEICARAYKLLTDNGLGPQDIIFDVNVLSVGTGIAEHSRYAVDFIEAVRWIKSNLPGARTSGGISNLSFAFRGNNAVREAMHSAFLYHAIAAGLDMAIVNPAMLQVYDEIEPELRRCVEDVIFDTDDGATERLTAKAQTIMEASAAAKEAAERMKVVADNEREGVTGQLQGSCAEAGQGTVGEMGVEARLADALINGRTAGLAEDVLECLRKSGSAVAVIEGPLMAGMERVGELFGAGRMFLPQVVKSAKVMRDAVAVLEPYMDRADASAAVSRPVVINATVKGDVHDIGKNITGIVLACNGFNVVDLGVMVDKETIIAEALAHKADIIGVSGLITPSLFQMEELCREMTARGLSVPLFIGGATTSALHAAVKLAPLYGHVFYSPDASASAVMAKRCMMDRDKFETEEHAKQLQLRELYEKKSSRTSASRVTFAAEDYLQTDSSRIAFDYLQPRVILNSVQDLLPHFDWRMFLAVWGIKYGAELPDDPEIEKILADGRAALQRLENEAEVRLSLRFFDAYSENDDIVLDNGVRLPMLRQEVATSFEDGACAAEASGLSLCDFVPPADLGIKSPFGIFALSVQPRQGKQMLNQVQQDSVEASRTDEYESMMLRAVRVTLAEAASTRLDGQLHACLIPSGCGEQIIGATAGEPDDNSSLGMRGFKVIKPAAGYAACPDHSLKKDILDLLPDSDSLGISLTESYAMIPDASICGFIIAHRKASYPDIRKVSRAQYDDYASRRGLTEDEARRLLGHLL